MNKAITDGIDLMPPPFIDGLDDWSREDGTPGSVTYSGAADATLVASDPDFGPCLEIQKTEATQKLRYMGEIPVLSGCYLEVRARIKVMSGLFPLVRIAGWAGDANGAHFGGLTEVAPSATLDTYGRIYTVRAIIGSGARTGVDMPWGSQPVYGRFGLDLTGDNGGVVRIESVEIEDVTRYFHRKLMDWVDVRDFGAMGDGVTDDRAAIEAADANAGGKELLFSEGSYYVNGSLTLQSKARFDGNLLMADGDILALTQNFDYPSYVRAFDGDETLALKKALQALMNYSDHESLDLCGRRIQLSAPIDVHAAVGNKNSFATRRVIRNGSLEAQTSTNWDDVVVTSSAQYSTANPTQFTNVTNVAQIPVGSLVKGQGTGREVYVTDKDETTGTVTLSTQLYDAPATQTYTFRRFQYLLDFSGFTRLARFEIDSVDFLCSERSSGIMLAKDGIAWHIRNCLLTKPKDRGITSIGTACAGMAVESNEFIVNDTDYSAAAGSRTSIALNANSNDVKIRNNRAMPFRHFCVLAGGGNLIVGNHFWQGDSVGSGERTAGIVFGSNNCKSVLNGNYIDNCFIELGCEAFNKVDGAQAGTGYGTLSMTGNIFNASDVQPWFVFVSIRPIGSDHRLDGISVVGNTFKIIAGGQIDRIDGIDTTFGTIDPSQSRNITIGGNSFKSVTQRGENPLRMSFTQASEDQSWTIDSAGALAFGGQALGVNGLSAIGPITGAGGVGVFSLLYVARAQGAAGQQAVLNWEQPVKGAVQLEIRSDLNG